MSGVGGRGQIPHGFGGHDGELASSFKFNRESEKGFKQWSDLT